MSVNLVPVTNNKNCTMKVEEQQLTCNRIFKLLTFYSLKHFTGRLDIQLADRQTWRIYLTLGRLAWATGGTHSVRRLKRQLSLCNLTPGKLEEVTQQLLVIAEEHECLDYRIAAELAKQGLLNSTQIMTLTRGVLEEVLFDIVQVIELASTSPERLANQSGENVTLATVGDLDGTEDIFSVQAHAGIRPSLTEGLPHTWMQSVQDLHQQVQQTWEHWRAIGLAQFSPNLALTLKQPQKLRQLISAQMYDNLVLMMKGQRTLRDLAARMWQEPVEVARVLAPYIEQQLIGWLEVPDIPLLNPQAIAAINSAEAQPPLNPLVSSGQKLVVCIDSSLQTQTLLEAIVTLEGDRFQALVEGVDALSLLSKTQPNLIFLDLTMPIVNGYELCTQIRRIEHLKEIPIIAFASHLVGRMRARLVGITDFLTKPLEVEKVRAVLRKYNLSLRG